MHDKTEHVIHMVNLKQALNHGLVFKKIHRMSKLNQNAWLKPYNINIKWNMYFFKLMNNAVFGKTMKNVENIEILNLVLEPNYHNTKLFTEDLLAREMKKKQKKNRNTYE